jgi:hypothetical protein
MNERAAARRTASTHGKPTSFAHEQPAPEKTGRRTRRADDAVASSSSSFALDCAVLQARRSELQWRAFGLKVEVVDRTDRPEHGTAGDPVCTAPFPSMPLSFRDDPRGAANAPR